MNEKHSEEEIEDAKIREPRFVPEPADEGKDVVGTEYGNIGMVTDVQGNTMYVDPNTSLTERLKRKLDWEDDRDTGHPIVSEFIKRIGEDVVLTVERDDGRSANDG